MMLGGMVEVGMVGHEGMVGLPVFLGANTLPYQVIVQVADLAIKMKVLALKDELKRGCALQNLLLRYTQALIIQLSQTIACYNAHTADKRLWRWVLMIHDQVRSDDFPITYRFISEMVGRAPRRRDGGLRQSAAGWTDPPQSRKDHDSQRLRLGRRATVFGLPSMRVSVPLASSCDIAAVGLTARDCNDRCLTLETQQKIAEKWHPILVQ